MKTRLYAAIPSTITRAGAIRLAQGWQSRAEQLASLAGGIAYTPKQRASLLADVEAARMQARRWAARAPFCRGA